MVGVGGGGEEVFGYIEYDSSLLASCMFIFFFNDDGKESSTWMMVADESDLLLK